MTRVFIVYDTKYRNTKLVADKIAEGMREVTGIETEVHDVQKLDLKKLADAMRFLQALQTTRAVPHVPS